MGAAATALQAPKAASGACCWRPALLDARTASRASRAGRHHSQICEPVPAVSRACWVRTDMNQPVQKSSQNAAE